MILALRAIATVAVLSGWFGLSSLNHMAAMFAIKTSMRLTEREKEFLVRRADRDYWVILTLTGCIAAGLLALVWRRVI